jgi:hypothetical protein
MHQRLRVVDLQLAIVRFVPRDTAQPTVFAGSPLPPAPDRPGCLLLNKLPFQVRLCTSTLLVPLPVSELHGTWQAAHGKT